MKANTAALAALLAATAAAVPMPTADAAAAAALLPSTVSSYTTVVPTGTSYPKTTFVVDFISTSFPAPFGPISTITSSRAIGTQTEPHKIFDPIISNPPDEGRLEPCIMPWGCRNPPGDGPYSSSKVLPPGSTITLPTERNEPASSLETGRAWRTMV
ncbi:hypothetical protein J7T55_011704 [Diaporthe amygdali]|uniref:uncharacterized protein n=1 Tax=Phomopsis amygdali TaxID=1214568 RepID=UPI0022FF3E34|nr:uncharacterized protein J7T55_011704 [Diaporthe amygdali]KAJ0123240.1 hypothetical protein J7T55_011704 [Diaporthe amygdali]